ncbi:hypothetical protein IWW45_001410 [Coemansia sp. RSA 485]|nr:hypothetical protein IWW45_001410 [Coemansia sp. RSA 485]
MAVRWTWLTTALVLLGSRPSLSEAASVAPEDKIVSYPPSVRTKPGSFIVEMDETLRATSANAFIKNIESVADVTVSNQFTKAFNGFAVAATASTDPVQLAKIRGVKRVWPVRYHTLSYEKPSLNTTSNFLHHMTGVERVLREMGISGKGVKIGIVDSGVDYNHPELGACWKTPGCPWQYGADYIGDKYDFLSDSPVVDPNPTPMDCDGHGTHVSGIIGARGPTIQGVAPNATLGMYRVFSCPVAGQVSAPDDILLQGIEAAFMDGHDIISLSLGGGGWPEDPLSVACARIADQGVVVVAANGNDGRNGLFTAGSPAVGRGVISVGSVDNWNVTGPVATINTALGSRVIYLSVSDADRPFDFPLDVPLVAPLDVSGSHLGCANHTVSLAGKAALVERGICSFSEKALLAQQAGAVALLVYNNVDGVTSPATDAEVNIPVAMIYAADGRFALDGLANGVVTVSAAKNTFGTFPSDLGGGMSDFSSFGPSPELGISPVISAPGGNIFSTYPLNQGRFATLSGTSMATPYVSGVAALLKQARPELGVKDIQRLLLTTAKPLNHKDTGKLIHPYWSGSGLVNVYDAIKARAGINPPVLSLNDTHYGVVEGLSENHEPVRWSSATITIKNTDGSRGMSVVAGELVADSLSMYAANGTLLPVPRTWPDNNSNNVTVACNTLPRVVYPNIRHVVAGESVDLHVYIVAPSGLSESDRWFYGGFLNFTLQWEGESSKSTFVVPYAGYNGNYRNLDVLSSSSLSGLPALADSSEGIISDPSQLVVSKNSTALLLYSIDVPTRVVSATMVDANNKTLGYLGYGYQEYNIRNLPLSEPSISGALIADSVYKDKEGTVEMAVPPGKYHVRLEALRPFGDVKNKRDYQTWDSASFIVK